MTITLNAEESRSKVGTRPNPRSSAEEMTGGGGVSGWQPGIGNYNEMLRLGDYTAQHMDVVHPDKLVMSQILILTWCLPNGLFRI